MESNEKNNLPSKGTSEFTDALTRFPGETADPVLHIDDDGILLYINPAAKSLLNEWGPRVGDPLPEDFLAALNHCLETTGCAQTGIEVKVKDRQMVFTPIRLADTNFLYGHEVTWWRRYEDHLKLLANVFENVGESIMITDTLGIIKTVNPAFTAMNGFTAEEVIGKTPRCLRSGRHGSEFYKWMWHEIAKKGAWKGKIWNRRKNGEIYPALLSITAIRDSKGAVTHYCSICHDISGRKHKLDQLQFEAYHDALTGLPNMQIFYDRLDQAFRRSRKDGSLIGILVVNLNRFRQFNQDFGYRRGDLLLQHVARRLRLACGDHDTLTRPAADEFMMIMYAGDGHAGTISARAQQVIRSFSVPINLKGDAVRVSIRVGIAIFPQTAADMHTLLEQAQAAVELAKQKGGDRFEIHR